MTSPLWTIRGRPSDPPAPDWNRGRKGKQPCFRLWGIVNITPDSFHDGGHHFFCQNAVAHARRLAEEGASVLDLGGASSRPGAEEIPVQEETARVLPVLNILVEDRKKAFSCPSFPLLSVDTWRAKVAVAALEAGADVINDISACSREPALRDILAQYRPGYVLMHSRGCFGGTCARPNGHENVLDELLDFFEQGMKELTAAGLPESNILLDPGVGFGKNNEESRVVLTGIERLFSLGRPLLLGVSHKSLFGDLLGLGPDARTQPTLICSALMAARGVQHHRVHDVAATRQALELTALLGTMSGDKDSGRTWEQQAHARHNGRPAAWSGLMG